jgi:hypothetical protein
MEGCTAAAVVRGDTAYGRIYTPGKRKARASTAGEWEAHKCARRGQTSGAQACYGKMLRGWGWIRNSAKNGLRGDQSGGRQEDELGDDEDGDEDSNADKRHGEYGLERRQQTRPNGKGVEHDCRR